MYRIAKEFHFSASHQLTHLGDSHPCSRLHGHNYRVEIMLAALELNADGMVVDFGDLEVLRKWIDHHWDHRHLNHYFAQDSISTTSENLAFTLFRVAKEIGLPVWGVKVSETPKTWAEYVPD